MRIACPVRNALGDRPSPRVAAALDRATNQFRDRKHVDILRRGSTDLHRSAVLPARRIGRVDSELDTRLAAKATRRSDRAASAPARRRHGLMSRACASLYPSLITHHLYRSDGLLASFFLVPSRSVQAP